MRGLDLPIEFEEVLRHCRIQKEMLQRHADASAGSGFRAWRAGAAQERASGRAPRIQKTVAQRVSALEKKVERQERAIKELEIRLGPASSRQPTGDVVRRMESAFKELEYVIRVGCDVLPDGTRRVVIVHVLDESVEAFRTICKKSSEVQNAFENVEIAPLVLHEDEVLDEHFEGTKTVFSRAGRQAPGRARRGLAGQQRRQQQDGGSGGL